ncbi:MAG: Crp/Fnr family transcriptional regulator [Pseudomonadota bacterium]
MGQQTKSTQRERLREQLAEAPYFAGLDPHTVDALVLGSRYQECAASAPVFDRGEPSDAVFLVVSGEIEISVMSESGRFLNVAQVRPGELFGEFGAIDGGTRTADASALSAALLIRIKSSHFLQAVTASPVLSQQVMVDVISKLRQTNIQIEEMTFRPLRARVARLILSLSDDGKRGIIKITQSQLAARLSATREKVNGHLRSLHRKGAIALRRGAIEITDESVLQIAAEETGG